MQPAVAQAPADTEAGDRVTRLAPVAVIASPETTAGSAYVLGAEELDKFKSTNVNDVLRTVPGVYVREENGLGFFPRIGIRASSSGRSDRISLLEDGIPAAMSPYANTSAYYFPNIGRISNIEVLKGPEVLLHGPHTTSGVVNLISTPIPAEPAARLNVEIGSFETRKIHAWYGATHGQWGFLLETYQGESDGFQKIERSKHSAGYDIDEYVAKVRWTSAPDARFAQQLDLKLQYDTEYGDVSYLGQTDADFKQDPDRRYGLSELERMNRGRRAASLRHQIGLTENNWLDTTAYWTETYRYYNRLNQINGISLGGITGTINNGGTNAGLLYGILRGTADTTHANGVRYGHNHQRFTVQGLQVESRNFFTTGRFEHELIGGVRYSQETPENAVKGLSNSIYQQVNGSLVFQRTDTAVPTEGELNALEFWLGDRILVGNLTLLPVIRHERIDSKANIAATATPAQIAARLSNDLNKTTVGLGATYAVNERWTLLAGIHEGFAPPGNGVGPGTKGEESTNYEAGVRFRTEQVGVDVIGFYSDYQNTLRQCLFANPCTNPLPGGAPIVDGSTQQTGAKEVYGLEFSVSGDLYRGTAVKVPLRFSYTYTDGEYHGGSDLPTGVRKGDVIEYTPKNIVSLQLGLEGAATHGAWNVYAAVNFTDDSYTSNIAGRPGVDSTYLRTQSLFTTDLVASYPLNERLGVYFRIDNVFDEQRITHRGADGARGNASRWTSLGLRLNF
ncbi:MAG: TonB-dependent receptor [Sinobacteraceae bacterium]|nr:TonB-dependent receptor [Nevskiaceae bacterium]